VLWGNLAENAAKYLNKGKPVLIEGRLQLDQWDDRQTGQKRQRLKVVAESMQFLGSRDPNGVPPPMPGSRPLTNSFPARPPHNPDLDHVFDDIPF
jgi:single-strand DNA-binding protein